MKRFLFLSSLLAAGALQADVKLASVFTDNLVLQQGKPVPVWGTADPSEEVTVSFGSQSKKATADKDGSWKVALDKLEANADPQDLKVKGKNELTLKNVLVGEVWICSGQSNMQMSVKSSLDAEKEIPAANYPQIRLFTVPNIAENEPQKEIKGTKGWLVCTPENIPGFSAVAYFFGRELNSTLKVPIGLINTSWGGTRAEAWTSKPALEAVPVCKPILTGWEDLFKTYDAVKLKEQYDAAAKVQLEKIARMKEENAKPGATQQKLPNPPGAFQDQSKSPHRPAVLFNGMIAPLVPYAVKGAIWYQGESNQRRAVQYETLMPTLIKDWRAQWNDELSFYIVQLAGFGPGGRKPLGADDTWAELQWAQFLTAIKTPKCGLAVTNDIGDVKDIHPKNKQEVGRRLALQALFKDYKKTDILPGGPVFAGADVTGNKVVVNFSNGTGLKARDGGELKGFRICGADKVWKEGVARIFDGRPQVVVTHPDIANPVAVRYAWEGFIPEANLVNKDGLPAGLFRSDKFDLSTKGIENPFNENPPKPAAPAPAAPAKKDETAPAGKPGEAPAPAKKAA